MPLAAKMAVDPPKADKPTLHLSSREVPPGGLMFKIVQLAEKAPREAWVGPFNSIYDLKNETNKRERANGLPQSSEAEIEDQVCQRLPPGYCRDSSNRRTTHPGALSMHLADVIQGTKALLGGWLRHGSVDNAEIARRTAICNGCPENQQIQGCQGCAANALHAVMNAIVVRRLPSDAMLGACTVCKCSLPAKVRFHLEDLPPLTAEQRARLPEHCWIIAPISMRDADPRT